MTEYDSEPVGVCQNCGYNLDGSFCSYCGQQDREVKRPLLALIKELFHAVFELDGRAYRTLYYLFCKPAYLSQAYIEGRRASFTPPLRLFLVLSILLFFMISANSFINTLDDSLSGNSVASTQQTGDESVENEAADGITIDRVDDQDLQEIREFIDSIVVPTLSAETNANLVAFIRNQATTNYDRIRQDPEEFLYGSLDYITVFMLVMMPLLAAILKMLYFFSRHFYLEHMILTLHNHTFLILAMMINIPLNLVEESNTTLLSIIASIAGIGLNIWMAVYLFLSLKNYFGQGYLLTTLKFITATLIYSVLLLMGLAVFLTVFFILF